MFVLFYRLLVFLFILGTAFFCLSHFLSQVLANEANFQLKPDGSRVGTEGVMSADYAIALVWFHEAIYFFALGVSVVMFWLGRSIWRRRQARTVAGFEVSIAKEQQ